MSDKELEEILNEVKKRANANMPIDPPEPSRSADSSNQNKSDEVHNITPELKFDENPDEKSEDDLLIESKAEKVADKFEFPDFIESEPPKSSGTEDLREFSKPEKKKSKKGLIIVMVIILIIALGVGIYFGFFHKKEESEMPQTTKEIVTQQLEESPKGPANPLTGERGYNETAVGKRPVAVVVENEYSTESVRPQWGLSDADIVFEAESEFSTRLLLFWADYTDMPEMIGPCRSARPPFIRFSQLFDSVFIHCGLSKSKGNYVGADTVFESENVDHINGLNDTMDGTYFGRNYDRTSTVEHTAYLNGANVEQLLENKNIDTALEESKFSAINFNEAAQPLSDISATSVKFIWSNANSGGKCPKNAEFMYDISTEKYTTSDFDSQYGTSDVAFENLIFLLDETEYVVKEDYKGSGKSETYCDYKLSGGKGTVLSQGTAVEIEWGVDNGKLWMKTSDGKNLVLNPGKSYIGYGSSNHGGAVTINPAQEQ